MMDTIEITTIRNDEELEQVYELWERVFPEVKGFFKERLELDGDYDRKTTWIAKVNGEIAASVQLFPYHFYYGDAILKVGGIGNVATLPEFRGRGLTQTILKRQTEWMEANDYDLSLLSTDIHSFYEKVGWHMIPYRNYTLENVPELIDNNTYTIEDFSESDLQDVARLYDAFIKRTVGARIRTATYWENQLNKTYEKQPQFLVARYKQKIVAYLRYHYSNQTLVLEECCYDASHETAALALVKEAIARNADYQNIRMSFAHNHVLTSYFQEWGAKVSDVDANMWKIINLPTLIGKLKLEFAKTIPEEKISILLQCGQTDFLLDKHGDILDIKKPTESFSYNLRIKCSEVELTRAILHGPEGGQLEKIFPDVAYQFWSTDSF